MFEWISSLFANVAFNAAIHSAEVASYGGMHQPEEPEELKKYVCDNK